MGTRTRTRTARAHDRSAVTMLTNTVPAAFTIAVARRARALEQQRDEEELHNVDGQEERKVRVAVNVEGVHPLDFLLNVMHCRRDAQPVVGEPPRRGGNQYPHGKKVEYDRAEHNATVHPD